MNTIEFKDKLEEALVSCSKIQAIGQTGNLNQKLIPGQSDIDLFVLCKEIPSQEERKQMYEALSEGFSPHN